VTLRGSVRCTLPTIADRSEVVSVVCNTYRIVVDGELDELTAAAFSDLALVRADGRTVLSTGDIDQAALNGILDRLRAVGAVLVGLDRSAAGASPTSGR
jgi:hypothetical protein